ncbi:hypothetical protein ECPA42_3634, partial [Escherichia coli PA42]
MNHKNTVDNSVSFSFFIASVFSDRVATTVQYSGYLGLIFI